MPRARDPGRAGGGHQGFYTRDRGRRHVPQLLLSRLRHDSLLADGQTPRQRPGVALARSADPHFAVPVRSVWEQAKHDWVEIGVAGKHFQQGSVAEPGGAATR
jgi:hypothetical protein